MRHTSKMKLLLILIIILYQAVEDQACGSAAKAKDPSKKEAVAAWDYYIKYARGFKNFKPQVKYSSKQKERYGRWLLRYMHKKINYPPELEWPQPPMFIEWQGWGNGESGQNPPPWAINRNSFGKPKFCLYELKYGDCKYNFNRYGFDALKGRCSIFTYSGCGGNANNFMNMKVCEESCGTNIFSEQGCCGYDDFQDKEKVLDEY